MLPSAKTVTAAAWSVRAKKRAYRTDGAYREVVSSYGVRLLVLAAKWSPQAFWVGDGRPTAAGVACSHHKALRR